LTVISNLWKL